MVIVYRTQTLNSEPASYFAQSSAEENDYAARLREVEKSLLCQALGGQLPKSDSQQCLQTYLDGEVKGYEALQPPYYPAGHN